MKSVRFVFLILLTIGYAHANDLVYTSEKLEKTTFVASTYQSEISYQSKGLPA